MSRETAGFLTASLLMAASTLTVALGGFSESLVEFFSKWQTLIAGAIAFGGAWLTVRVIRDQIATSKNAETDQRQRESYAARSVLPVSLSLVCQYAMECIRLLDSLVDSNGTVQKRSPDYKVPPISSDIISPMQECIRFVDQENAKGIADLLSWLQIQSARINSLEFHSNGLPRAPSYSIYRHMIDAAEIHARAEALFSYARRLEEGPPTPMTKDDARKALNLCGIYEGCHPTLDRMLSPPEDT